MKILFTADWHIKIGQKNVPRAWATARYNELFSQVTGITESCDVHVIGGDIFDRTPSLDELNLFFAFVASVTVHTIIYDGNHEATRKGKTFLSVLAEVVKILNPLVTIVTEVTEYDWGTILPYCALHKKGVIEGLDKSKPLFTHVRGEIPPHVKPEVDLSIFEDFPVVYTGDLHAHSNTQLNLVYPGSPLTTSFHRNEVETGYISIYPLTNTWDWDKFELPQLIRKTVTDPDDMVPTGYHHTIYELEGDLADLANVKNSSLLDKKVVKRNSEAALVLTKEMTLVDELAEYLMYILGLEESEAKDIVGTFSDYTTKT